ncbi:ABC transporter permease [Roseibium aggregatum]|uniref:Octopine transport system permease protein OccM n=1 Tax=Roseibium aggregatum TaxID=187304 RepID=A0A0M6YCM0_9HYPH|nr:ABC transporter permease subunit [Roseibium aggregatum]CTQ47454.1 Octopine transport system permease protein OccM [Roseibium aggregatum]
MFSHFTGNLDLWGLGLFNTLRLTVLGFVLGFFVAIPIALARLGGNPFVSRIASGYVYVIRGTPLLVQIFIIYYGLGQFHREMKDIGLWWFFRDAFSCGLTAFILNSAAYQSEIIRGGIVAVPKGAIEAGASLGLSRWQIFRKIVMPIMLARMLPAFGNELVLLLKASALVSVITVRDVMGQARYLYAQTFDLSVFYVAAVNYLLVILLIEALWRRLEGRSGWLRYEGTT